MKINLLLLFLFVIFSFGCDKKDTEKKMSSADQSEHGEANHSYYTCTMHTQIHEHKPGNCPICGMPLVKVEGKMKGNDMKDGSGSILPSDYQKKVLQFTKGPVERKNVAFEVPAGGRHLSANQVAFYIYESDLMRVRVGEKFVGECPSMPGQELSGKITQIDTVADPSSRSVRVIGTITSPHHMNLTEGSFFGKIKTSPVSTLMIPYDAVLRTGKENIVYRVGANGSLEAVRVALGMTHGNEIEITSGLEEGDMISYGPNFLIDSESRLKGTDSMNMEGM